MRPEKARPAQIFSFDFASSASIFMIFFVIFLLAYSRLKDETDYSERMRNLMLSSNKVSDVLVGTKGFPEDWTNETVETIGLASEENVLSSEKISSLLSVSYSSSKSLLPLGNFELFLNLSELSTGNQIFEYGPYPSNNSTSIVPTRRLVLYSNGTGRTLAKLEVLVWE